MKAMNSQDDITSIPLYNFKDYYVVEFDLTSMRDPTANIQYPEKAGEPLRLELNFTFPLNYVRERIVLWERMSSVAAEKVGVVGKKI